MMTLEERKQNRWLMLRKFYELAGGSSSPHVIDLWQVGKELGWDQETTEVTYDYLQGEGLLKAVTLGGGASITHQGVREVEAAEEHSEKPTLHFPPFVVNISGTSGGNIVVGDRNTVVQSNEAASEGWANVLRDLRSRLEGLNAGVSSEAVANLLDALHCSEPDRFQIARLVSSLAGSDRRVRHELLEFRDRAVAAPPEVRRALDFALEGS